MKYFLIIIAVFTLFSLVSCNQAKKDSGQTQQVPVLPPTQEQPAPAIIEPVEPVETETTAQTSPEQNNTEVMLNPPHGEPFHRCEIPVGAPLNSAPATTEPVQAVEAETAAQPSPEQNNAEVMLNPPHGEPFHRCEIPVGAPLNSAPATTEPVQATAPQTSGPSQSVENNPFAPTVENARRMNSSQPRRTTAPASGTKPQLNPPHGQPWHRCDIAVGSPLP